MMSSRSRRVGDRAGVTATTDVDLADPPGNFGPGFLADLPRNGQTGQKLFAHKVRAQVHPVVCDHRAGAAQEQQKEESEG